MGIDRDKLYECMHDARFCFRLNLIYYYTTIPYHATFINFYIQYTLVSLFAKFISLDVDGSCQMMSYILEKINEKAIL